MPGLEARNKRANAENICQARPHPWKEKVEVNFQGSDLASELSEVRIETYIAFQKAKDGENKGNA